MSVFYSPATGGFYRPEFHGNNIPPDVFEITEDEYSALAGRVVVLNAAGRPVAESLTPPPDFSAEIERAWRDRQLSITDSIVTRHRDELEEGSETTLAAEQYTELQAYRRALRNWPEAGEFPLIEHRPSAPSWLTEDL
ncbi:phage tail assembly chaperone [Pseudomonas protegens]|uniref:phage tail assembly chaperone n=1 Tax=Pseudomonas protegens TaxID=380021 RepID=UPI000F4CD44B|nr:phage tail assembly chaperone [Pseudomonas protegens]